MAYKGIDFRATSGYMSDPANYTYSLGEATPTVRGGYTFGWNTNLTASSRDRGNSYTAQQAGIVFVNNLGGATNDFTWTLPDGAGTYDFKLCAGDFTAAQNTKIVILDGASTLATISGTTIASNFLDASGASLDAATWQSTGGGTAISLVFAGTTFTLRLGGHVSAALASVVSSVALNLTSGAATGVRRTLLGIG